MDLPMKIQLGILEVVWSGFLFIYTHIERQLWSLQQHTTDMRLKENAT